MGVPKFFRYISERYPCLSEFAREQHMPEFDNLYLDMNGILHKCSHPDDNQLTNLTEEEMFKNIFNYIDKLFFLIKPQRLFYMSVDGVAPRAKMNQQRCRRFRTAKEAELMEKIAKRKGIEIPANRFDSNCISPGTEFMANLHTALRYFIKCKISADPLWQKCRVILSGQETPGEGEHKIMDYIRFLRSEKGYDPNTRHCLYGNDADLIILALCTHEVHFVILREEVKFTSSTKMTSFEEIRFILLYVNLLREYIELDFYELQQYSNFNLGDLIDDWVLMGFLVGNDFIPHLPCLHIAANAIPLLYKTYKDIFPSLGGNINEHGTLNLERLEKYFIALSEVELDIFQQKYAELKYFTAEQNKNDAFNFDVNDIRDGDHEQEMNDINEATCQLFNGDDNLSDDSQNLLDEFETYKRDFYLNKVHKNGMDGNEKYQQTVAYIGALQWILDYYYRGVQSWSYFYPYHYAPFVSDLRNVKDYVINFNIGKPYLPFQQLLAILPASSKDLLPVAYHDLMTNPHSPIISFYPEQFETDLNGKKYDWEALVLIPFIDETMLFRAMETCNDKVTPKEQRRNRHGPMYEYEFTDVSQGSVEGIYNLRSLSNVFCTETPFWTKDIAIPSSDTVFVELPADDLKVYIPGFPTMKHLDIKFELRSDGVMVFSYPSRIDNMILKPVRRKDCDNVLMVAEKYLNQVVYIGWPHLIKAKVVAVFSKEKCVDSDGFSDMMSTEFDSIVNSVSSHLRKRMGIDFGDLTVLVKVRTYVGTKMNFNSQSKITKVDSWSENLISYPAQGLVSKISVYNGITNEYDTVKDLFPKKSRIFFIGNPYYGSEGSVLNPLLFYQCGRLKVNITVLPEPDLSEVKFMQATFDENYIVSYDAATVLGINARILSRITTSILVVPKGTETDNDCNDADCVVNIGLSFKNWKSQTQLAGYAKLVDGNWMLSTTAISLAEEYCRRFPQIIQYLNLNDRCQRIAEHELFVPNCGVQLEDVTNWLKEKGHLKSEMVKCSDKLVEKDVVENILQTIEQLKVLPVKTVKLQVKPHLLIKPDVTLPEVYKSSRNITLFDRVVVVKSTYTVPLGARGTVIGISPDSETNPLRMDCLHSVTNYYDILFDKQVPKGYDIYGIAVGRVQRVPEPAILLISLECNKLTTKQLMSKLDEQLLSEGKRTTLINWRSMRNNQRNSYISKEPLSIDINNTMVPIKPTPKKAETNFWMPDKCAMETEKATLSSNANIVKNVSPTDNTIPVLGDLQTCHKETVALKSLLGMSPSKKQEPIVAVKSIDSVAEPNVPQLPQPPVSWYRNTTNVSMAAAPIQSPMQPRMHAPPNPMMPTGLLRPISHTYSQLPIAPQPLLQPNSNLHFSARHFPPISPYQHPPQRHHIPEPLMGRCPKRILAPSMLRPQYHTSYERPYQPRSHMEAFVPLQVVRNSRQNTTTTYRTNTTNNTTADNLSNCNNNNAVESCVSNDLKSAGAISDAERKQKTGERKPTRTPRIAAKFDKIWSI